VFWNAFIGFVALYKYELCSLGNADEQEILNGKKRIKKSLAKCFGGCQDVPDCLELKDRNSELGKHLSRY